MDNIIGLTRMNPMAPPVYGGLMTPDGDTMYDYPHDAVLVAGTTPDNGIVKTDTDADFHMCAIIVNQYTDIRFSILVNINGVYYMSESAVLAGNLVSDPAAPMPVLGKFIIPRGANINVQLVNLSGAENTVQLLFRGMKKYGSGRK